MNKLDYPVKIMVLLPACGVAHAQKNAPAGYTGLASYGYTGRIDYIKMTAYTGHHLKSKAFTMPDKNNRIKKTELPGFETGSGQFTYHSANTLERDQYGNVTAQTVEDKLTGSVKKLEYTVQQHGSKNSPVKMLERDANGIPQRMYLIKYFYRQ